MTTNDIIRTAVTFADDNADQLNNTSAVELLKDASRIAAHGGYAYVRRTKGDDYAKAVRTFVVDTSEEFAIGFDVLEETLDDAAMLAEHRDDNFND